MNLGKECRIIGPRSNYLSTRMQEPKILVVLKDAQTAHQAGDFVNALKFYEHFFDHALDDDPYALYAVRLSHCLHGWAELAEAFPGAKHALERKKREMLDLYKERKEPERFHDFFSISRVLGTESDALEQFLILHHENPKSAAKLSKYVWDDLINREHWQVCSNLMAESNQKLDELFSVFDEASKLGELDPSFNKPQFDQHVVDTLLNDVERTVLVLRHAGRTNDIAAIQRQFFQGVDHRNHSLLTKQAHAKAAFLFSGH